MDRSVTEGQEFTGVPGRLLFPVDEKFSVDSGFAKKAPDRS